MSSQQCCGCGCVCDEKVKKYEQRIEQLEMAYNDFANRNSLLLRQIDMLNGDVEISLDEAIKNMREAAEKMQLAEGIDLDADREFEYWSEVVSRHPKQKEKLIAEKKAWELEQEESNLKALELMRTFIDDKAKCLKSPPQIRKRFKARPILSIIRENPSSLERRPASVLKQYIISGLDLIELRAIYAVLSSLKFHQDESGEKEDFRNVVRQKLKESLKIAQNAAAKARSEMEKIRASIYFDIEKRNWHRGPYGSCAHEELSSSDEEILSRALKVYKNQKTSRSVGRNPAKRNPGSTLNLQSILQARQSITSSAINNEEKQPGISKEDAAVQIQPSLSSICGQSKLNSLLLSVEKRREYNSSTSQLKSLHPDTDNVSNDTIKCSISNKVNATKSENIPLEKLNHPAKQKINRTSSNKVHKTNANGSICSRVSLKLKSELTKIEPTPEKPIYTSDALVETAEKPNIGGEYILSMDNKDMTAALLKRMRERKK